MYTRYEKDKYRGLDTLTLIDIILDREKEIKRLKEDNKSVIDKIKEYITSYESINTIQECETPEKNIGLDKGTFIEMVNRYMKVHDKILKLLEEIDE